MTTDPLTLAQALIRCRSVTPEEGGALALLADVLGAAGFTVERPVFNEPGTPDIANLYARFGTAPPCLVFAGHTDVVPPGDEAAWRCRPFDGKVESGLLYGRGAVDMKGGIAASIAAALDHVAQHGCSMRGSIAFLITGDEEGPAINGTVKLLAWARERGERFDACLLGEPTSAQRFGDTIKIGRRGSLTGRLAVHGRQGHVAYPDLSDNPIPRLVRLMAAVDAAPLDGGTAHFSPSNLEWTTVDVGNPATNVIPAEARATFNVRFNDLWTAATLADEIRSRLAGLPDPGAYDLIFMPSNSPAFLTEPGPFVSLVAEAVEAETGIRPALSTSGGTSDARFIKDYCAVVEFGPLNRTMHATDECISTDDLHALTRIYRHVIETTLVDENR